LVVRPRGALQILPVGVRGPGEHQDDDDGRHGPASLAGFRAAPRLRLGHGPASLAGFRAAPRLRLAHGPEALAGFRAAPRLRLPHRSSNPTRPGPIGTMIAGGHRSMPSDSPMTWTSIPSLRPSLMPSSGVSSCTPVPSLEIPAPIQPRQSLPTDVDGRLACSPHLRSTTSPNVLLFGPG